MSGIATAIVGGAVIGAVVTSQGAQSAADTQAAAANQASALQSQSAQQSLDFQKQALAQQQQLNKPFVDTGTSAMYQLADLLGVQIPGRTPQATPQQIIQNQPGYQFGLQQGQQALESSAAARGMQLSGASMMALDRYGQDYGTKAYQQQIANLGGLVSTGENAANMVGNAAGQFATSASNTVTGAANQIGSNMMGAGNAIAAGQVASSNAISNALNQSATGLGRYFGTPTSTGGFALDPSVTNWQAPTSSFDTSGSGTTSFSQPASSVGGSYNPTF